MDYAVMNNFLHMPCVCIVKKDKVIHVAAQVGLY